MLSFSSHSQRSKGDRVWKVRPCGFVKHQKKSFWGPVTRKVFLLRPSKGFQRHKLRKSQQSSPQGKKYPNWFEKSKAHTVSYIARCYKHLLRAQQGHIPVRPRPLNLITPSSTRRSFDEAERSPFRLWWRWKAALSSAAQMAPARQ